MADAVIYPRTTVWMGRVGKSRVVKMSPTV